MINGAEAAIHHLHEAGLLWVELPDQPQGPAHHLHINLAREPPGVSRESKPHNPSHRSQMVLSSIPLPPDQFAMPSVIRTGRLGRSCAFSQCEFSYCSHGPVYSEGLIILVRSRIREMEGRETNKDID